MKVTFLEVENPIDGTSETYAIIDKGNDEFVSMPKLVYEDQLKTEKAAKLNEPVSQPE